MVFINFSNHESNKWDLIQIKEALNLVKSEDSKSEIVDIEFPVVNPQASAEEVRELAQEYADKIMQYNPACVMCQGEFVLCYHVINILKKQGVEVVAACSERVVSEKCEDGKSEKISYFRFVRFRKY